MPSYNEVLSAVKSYFSEEGRDSASAAAFREWGAEAVPHLRKIAETEDMSRVQHGLVVVIQQIDSKDGAELFIDILDGKTLIAPNRAMNFAPIVVHGHAHGCLPLIVKHPRFKGAILARSAGSFLEQKHVASLARVFGWVDQVPMLRRMLGHEHLGVRTAAAEALRALTREDIQPTRPERSFPCEALREDLLAPPKLQSQLAGSRNSLRLMVPGHPPQVVTLSSDRYRGPGHAVAHDFQGNELWSFLPPGGRIESATMLADDSGTYGIALGLGGATSVVAIGPAGVVLWEIRNHHVVYEIRTHPELPGLLLLVGGNCFVFEHGPTGAQKSEMLSVSAGVRAYATEAELFPNARGEASIMALGSGDVPLVSRFDPQSVKRWSATLPSDCRNLTMFEPETGRLFALITSHGEVYVFDAGGMLLSVMEVPGAGPKLKHSVHGIYAHHFVDEDRWVLFVDLLTGSYGFDLNL